MIIDANVYVGEWPFRRLDASAPAVVDRMDEHDIDRGIVSALQAPMYKNPQAANHELLEDLAGFEDRFVPFATLDPTYPGAIADLDVCVDELGMRGVRLFPAYHDYALSDQPVTEFVQACAERDLPVMICAVLQDQRQRHPRVKLRDVGRKSYAPEQVDAMLDLLRSCPEADMIVADAMGNAKRINRKSSPRREGIWVYNAERSGRLCFTLDGLYMRYIAQGSDVLEAVDPEQIVFGSRLPLDYVSERAGLKLAHLPVDDGQRAAIRSDTVQGLLP